MSLNELAKTCYDISAAHGFHGEGQDNVTIKLALIMTEAAEAFEAWRGGNKPSDHGIEGLQSTQEELADVIIRVLDLACQEGWNMDTAVRLKCEYNKIRPFRHDKKF